MQLQLKAAAASVLLQVRQTQRRQQRSYARAWSKLLHMLKLDSMH